jgi:hypothetical protein
MKLLIHHGTAPGASCLNELELRDHEGNTVARLCNGLRRMRVTIRAAINDPHDSREGVDREGVRYPDLERVRTGSGAEAWVGMSSVARQLDWFSHRRLGGKGTPTDAAPRHRVLHSSGDFGCSAELLVVEAGIEAALSE